jgi:hypothetical protein
VHVSCHNLLWLSPPTIEIACGFQQTAKEIKPSAPIRFVVSTRTIGTEALDIELISQYPGDRRATSVQFEGDPKAGVHNDVRTFRAFFSAYSLNLDDYLASNQVTVGHTGQILIFSKEDRGRSVHPTWRAA